MAKGRQQASPWAQVNSHFQAWTQANRLTIGIVAVAFVIRVAFTFAVSDGGLYTTFAPWALDAADYDRLAKSMLAGEGFANGDMPTAWRPPLYPMFIAAIYAVAGPRATAVRLVQAILGTLTVWIIMGIARQLAPADARDNVGLFAGIGAAFYPWLFFWNAELLTETLYGTLALGSLLLWFKLLTGEEKLSLGSIWLAGLLAGLATLTRAVFLPTGLLLPWLVGFRKGRFVSVGLSGCIAMMAIVLSWTARNALELRHPHLVSSNGGYNLYLGTFGRERLITAFGIDVGEVLENPAEHQLLKYSEAKYDDLFSEAVWRYAQYKPLQYLQGRTQQFLRFWVVPGFVETSSPAERLLKVGLFLPIFIGGLAGGVLLVSYRRWPELMFLAVVMGTASLPYAVAFGAYRFRIPVIDPLLIALTAVALDWAVKRVGLSLTQRRQNAKVEHFS